jgi:hypothetical protein
MKMWRCKVANQLMGILSVSGMLLFFASCDYLKDSEEPRGVATLEITDAPVDDANVNGVYITISEIKVDGKVFAGFENKMTINLLDYQNGSTKLLGTGNVDAGNHKTITLVIDTEVDENGDSPGSFVLTNDLTKHKLISNAQNDIEIDLQKEFVIDASGSSKIVIDFDLRKTIRHTLSNESSDFEFVSEVELENSIRVINHLNSGTIRGTYDGGVFQTSGKVVAYVYKKGEWNPESEIFIQSANELRFKKAVNSSAVDASGNYRLPFLDAGEYEIHFVSYEKNGADDRMNFSSLFEVSSLTQGISPTSVTVDAQSEATLNVIVIGKII